MAELRSTENTLTQHLTPSRRQLVAGLGALSLGSLGILAGANATFAQDTTGDVEDDRFGRGRRGRGRGRGRNHRRRNRRHNH
jgi:hypothetical protein